MGLGKCKGRTSSLPQVSWKLQSRETLLNSVVPLPSNTAHCIYLPYRSTASIALVSTVRSRESKLLELLTVTCYMPFSPLFSPVPFPRWSTDIHVQTSSRALTFSFTLSDRSPSLLQKQCQHKASWLWSLQGDWSSNFPHRFHSQVQALMSAATA